jgi:hypothetical protein
MPFARNILNPVIVHSRDQYGFKMSSQWLSVEDYHEHDKLYQPIVDRRAQKWQQILAENDGKWPEPGSKCTYASAFFLCCCLPFLTRLSFSVPGSQAICAERNPSRSSRGGLVPLQWSRDKIPS